MVLSSATSFRQCFRVECYVLEFTQLLVGSVPKTLVYKIEKSNGEGYRMKGLH